MTHKYETHAQCVEAWRVVVSRDLFWGVQRNNSPTEANKALNLQTEVRIYQQKHFLSKSAVQYFYGVH